MSASMTQAQAQASRQFVMPKPEIGQTVHWYPAGDRSGATGRPVIAFPVLIGEQAIDVMLMQEDMKTLVRMDGVRHVDDPSAVRSEFEDFGSWDFTAKDKLLVHVVGRLEAIEKQLTPNTAAPKKPANKSAEE